MKNQPLNRCYLLTVLSIATATLFTGCATPKIDKKLFGNVSYILQREQEDPKTNVTSVVDKEYVEIAAKSLVDGEQDTSSTPQLVAEIGTYFSHYDVNDDKGVLVSIPNVAPHKGSDLWIVKTGKARLTNTNYHHHTPSFSDNGEWVLFSSRRGKVIVSEYSQDSFIWRMKSNATGGITQVGSPNYLYRNPQYSSDQSKILTEMISLKGEKPYIWYMESNGSLPTQLTPGENPSWLNDDTIVFCAKDNVSGKYCIWTTKLDGSLLTQLICDPRFDCIQPAPHPHGRYIAFVKQPSGATTKASRDIFVYNIENGQVQQITTNKSRDDLPNWSDDGSMLYFRSSRGLSWNVWRVPLEDLEK